MYKGLCIKASLCESRKCVPNSTFTSLLSWTCLLIFTSKQLTFTSSHLHISSLHPHSFFFSSAYTIFTCSHIFSLSLSLCLCSSSPTSSNTHPPCYDESHTYTCDHAPVRSRAIRHLVVTMFAMVRAAAAAGKTSTVRVPFFFAPVKDDKKLTDIMLSKVGCSDYVSMLN